MKNNVTHLSLLGRSFAAALVLAGAAFLTACGSGSSSKSEAERFEDACRSACDAASECAPEGAGIDCDDSCSAEGMGDVSSKCVDLAIEALECSFDLLCDETPDADKIEACNELAMEGTDECG